MLTWHLVLITAIQPLEPYHPVLMRLNAIGGNWSQHGRWIRWDFTLPQSGLQNRNQS